MRKLVTLFIFFTGILFFVTTAQAAPFIYNESISGDLVESLPAPTVFPFDIGVNSVLGNTHLQELPNNNLSLDFDSFAFSIPSGTQLTQVSYSFVASIEGSKAITEFQMVLGNQYTLPPLGDTSPGIDLTGASPVALFGAALPLGSGTYGIANVAFIHLGQGFSANYEWDFTVQPVAPVPEPSTIILLGSGLIGLAGYGRKKFFKK